MTCRAVWEGERVTTVDGHEGEKKEERREMVGCMWQVGQPT
jgi:hypothetical protein